MTFQAWKNITGIKELDFKKTSTGTLMAWPRQGIKVFVAQAFDKTKEAYINKDLRWKDTEGASYWVTNKSGDPTETFAKRDTEFTLS